MTGDRCFTDLKILPDHQLENFRSLSEDSIRLFRISLVVLSIYGSVFGVILESGKQAIVVILGQPSIAFGLLLFLISIGSFMTAYRYSRHFCSNAIKASHFIELSEEFPAEKQSNYGKESLIYDNYWRNSLNFKKPIDRIQIIVYIGGFSIYAAVVYISFGLVNLYLRFPDWLLLVILFAPMLIPFVLAMVLGAFTGEGSLVVAPSEPQERDTD